MKFTAVSAVAIWYGFYQLKSGYSRVDQRLFAAQKLFFKGQGEASFLQDQIKGFKQEAIFGRVGRLVSKDVILLVKEGEPNLNAAQIGHGQQAGQRVCFRDKIAALVEGKQKQRNIFK